MQFEEDKRPEKVGVYVGFCLSYCIFTGMLFLILTLLNKLPDSWHIGYVALITAAVCLTGQGLKRWLS